MKLRLPNNLPAAGKKEIKRQCVELNQEFIDNLEYAVAWVLHKHRGYGIKRLLDFREEFRAEIKRMTEFYESDDIYPAKIALRDMGYDIESLNSKDER